MKNDNGSLPLLKEAGAYLEGHFLLTSGLHSGVYLEKFRFLEYPKYTRQLCELLAAKFRASMVDVVVGPAMGGIILSYVMAELLSENRDHAVRGIFLEREENKLKLKRDFVIRKGEKVLVVEDVVTTGKSVFEVLDFLREAGTIDQVVGIACLVDRSGGKVRFMRGVEQKALFDLDIPTYEPAACPMCAKGIPLVKRGSRKLMA